jgi:2-amino-4-hydroxy-6-hydroxymethyldihydropteridine diphosphokinase
LNRTTTVAIALGSNLGDRDAHLDFAAARLSVILGSLRFSSRYDTDPLDAPGPQPRYLNAAVVGTTPLAPEALWRELQQIEDAAGRARPYVHAPRTLDLDLILFGDIVTDSPALTIPHPRFRERRFVLEPLAEVAPEMRDPVSGLTVGALFEQLRRA